MLKKTILVCGTGNSGSGAIHDLLLSSNKFSSPFQGQEFRMVHDPYGLDNLYRSFFESNNFYNFSAALDDFISYNTFLSGVKGRVNKKKVNLIKNKKHYNSLINRFLKDIVEVEYYAYPQFSKSRLTYSKNLNFKLKNLISSNKSKRPFRIILPKDKNAFLSNSKVLLNNIFHENLLKKKNYHHLINQGINIFDPINSSKYYSNPKIIIVLRDPKSIYFSMKSRRSFGYPGYNLDLFIKWYQNYMDRFKSFKNEKILYLNFESFFSNFDNEVKKLQKFLNIKLEFDNSYDFEKTSFNLYKAKKKLNKNEISKINKSLKKYLFW